MEKTFYDCLKKDVKSTKTICEEEGFIRYFGSLNCFYLTFKSYEEVVKVLEEKYPNEHILDSKTKRFIIKRANKEVLIYVDSPKTVFCFGDNNICFPVDCFL